MIKQRLQGMPVSSLCTQAKVSRKVFYFWWNRYQTQGWSGLQEKSKGRPCGPDVDDILRKKIVKLRLRYGWGGVQAK
jgi:transposase